MKLASVEPHYRMRIASSLSEIGQNQWRQLLASQAEDNPFLSYAFLDALHESGCAAADTGWRPCYITLWLDDALAAALPLYEKSHSYGEYVFDWAWAEAYQRHGYAYYPKLLSAVPFSPITGSRLLARDAAAQAALICALQQMQGEIEFSSSHLLFLPPAQAHSLQQVGFMLRSGVQFHWINRDYRNFEDFLAALDQKKRKNIRAERRKVMEEGVSFRHLDGREIQESDWIFFKRCYDKTYADHRSKPYLNLDFFLRIGRNMPQHLHLIIAERRGKPIAASLLVYSAGTAYGRYWGCTEHLPCLHFETAYYQAIEFCILQKIQVLEGGAQGEHKMCRGFLPQKTWSAHHLAHPAFANAIADFLERETAGVERYFNELVEHNPYKNR